MPARVCYWDIESTNLNADFGFILCVSWKFSDEKKAHVVSIADFPAFKKDCTNDYHVVKKAADEISKADIWVTHYGTRFDVPMIQTRLLKHGLKPMPPVPHVDTWRIAKYRLKLHSNRLASVSQIFGLADKTALNGPIWLRAMAGHKPSIKYVVEHCVQDVYVLEQAYEKIRCLSPDPPNMNLVDPVERGCPKCGEASLQARGYAISRTRTYQRFQCTSCGGWAKGPAVKTTVVAR